MSPKVCKLCGSRRGAPLSEGGYETLSDHIRHRCPVAQLLRKRPDPEMAEARSIVLETSELLDELEEEEVGVSV